MSNLDAVEIDDEIASPFKSLDEMRSEHSRLLKRLRDEQDISAFLYEVENFMKRGQMTGTLLDLDQDRWDAQRLLDYWSTMSLRAGYRVDDIILTEFDETLAPTLSDDLCPYLGLESFQKSDEDKFFGRQKLVAKMLDELSRNRLLAIVGPSGSGKSSVVMAGILPQLGEGALAGSESWNYFSRPMVPGSDPLTNLARLVRPPGTNSPDWIQNQADGFLRDPDHLLKLLNSLDDQPSVLVIDQFEEVFTLCDDQKVRQTFTDNLLQVIESKESVHVIILTMRADFEPFVARLPEFYTHFSNAQERIPPMEASELREAIELPAQRIGLKFEEGVINSLLQDVLGEPAALPLLQFTLLKLWENRRFNRITSEAYDRLGGGRLALARSADALLEGMTIQERKATQNIFLRMVRPGEGLEVTSYRIRRDSLLQGSYANTGSVLDKLLKARLVKSTSGDTPADNQVEVAHEALIRNWPTLVEWIEEDRVAIIRRRQLEAKAIEWIRLGRGEAGLLDAVQLGEAKQWIDSPDAVRLSYIESLPALIEASELAIKKGEEEKEHVYRLTVEQALKLAEAERDRAEEKSRAIKRARLIAVLLAFAFLAALLSAAFAIVQGRKAVEQRVLAEASAELASYNEHLANERLQTAKKYQEDAEDQARIAKEKSEEASRQSAIATMEGERAKKEAMIAAENLRKYEVAEKQRIRAEEEALEANTKAIEIREERKPAMDEIALALRKRGQVRPGASIDFGGSICCIVTDPTGKRFLLSVQYVFNGELGTPVLQPSKGEGGPEGDRVAVIHRKGNEKYTSGAIAELLPGIEYSLDLPKIGRLKGVAESVKSGDVVRMLGRGSGLSEGKVISVEPNGNILIDILSCCGDAGAPVVNADGYLVGMLWGGTDTNSIVIPIQPILRELNVELVK